MAGVYSVGTGTLLATLESPWDGRDFAGRRVAGGMYFYELEVDGAKQSRRLVEIH